MRILTVQLFLAAFLALSLAAVVPEAEIMEDNKVLEAEDKEIVPDAGKDAAMAKRSCPWGWSHLNGRCFRYFSTCRTWTQAERDCVSMQANLASVHNYEESVYINGLITASGDEYAEVWIGATDAQKDNIWFWSDGSKFQDANWCNKQPDDLYGKQHCVIMNHGASSCWGDRRCSLNLPYVCVKRNC